MLTRNGLTTAWIALLVHTGAGQLAHAADASNVDVWIGTGGMFIGSGMSHPAATWPLGLVRLGPDTEFGRPIIRALNRYPVTTSGYHYGHDRVRGFSHTRLMGTGATDGGLLRVLPLTNEASFRRGRATLPMDHRRERATPGYYAIDFDREAVQAELTSSIHCGLHRYRKSRALDRLHLLIDGTSSFVWESSTGPDSWLEVKPNTHEIMGMSRLFGSFSRRYGGLKNYYYGTYSTRAEEISGREGQSSLSVRGPTVLRGRSIGAGLRFARDIESVELRVCVSHVSIENAKANYAAEVADHTFSEVRALAAEAWNEKLGRIQIETRDPKIRTIFDTAVYHSFLMPSSYTDTNGQYAAFDGTVRVARGYTYRSDISLWDTYRTLHPLYTLIARDVQRDTLISLMEMARIDRVLPRWPYGTADSRDMIGSPANFIFAESYLKGFRDFDPREALEMMVSDARGESASDEFGEEYIRGRERDCVRLGYCPSDRVFRSVSKTLESAWSDFAAAQLAEAIGETQLAREFARGSFAYRKVWDAKSRFFRPRLSDGRFARFSPTMLTYFGFLDKSVHAYCEGSAHHWRWSVQHNPRDLVSLMGGEVAFVKELEAFLRGAQPGKEHYPPSPYYWHGNQHDFHATYLFNEAGRPDLTQKWARWAMRTRYDVGPKGLPGNDDAGTLSAWYILSAIGIFPQAGTDRYWLGSPAVDRAVLKLGDGRELVVIVRNQGPKNVYVQEVRANGVRICEPVIRHADLMGGRLEFTMGRQPAPRGGYDCTAR